MQQPEYLAFGFLRLRVTELQLPGRVKQAGGSPSRGEDRCAVLSSKCKLDCLPLQASRVASGEPGNPPHVTSGFC